jgi:hypothetical protein
VGKDVLPGTAWVSFVEVRLRSTKKAIHRFTKVAVASARIVKVSGPKILPRNRVNGLSDSLSTTKRTALPEIASALTNGTKHGYF